jgi:hypothetical protein
MYVKQKYLNTDFLVLEPLWNNSQGWDWVNFFDSLHLYQALVQLLLQKVRNTFRHHDTTSPVMKKRKLATNKHRNPERFSDMKVIIPHLSLEILVFINFRTTVRNLEFSESVLMLWRHLLRKLWNFILCQDILERLCFSYDTIINDLNMPG